MCIYVCRAALLEDINKIYTHLANYGATVTEFDTPAEVLQFYICYHIQSESWAHSPSCPMGKTDIESTGARR
jgi:hypothetical protein